MGAEGAKMSSEIQKRPYLSGQWTEQSLCDGAIAYHMSLTFTGVIFVYSGFLFAYFKTSIFKLFICNLILGFFHDILYII